MNTSAPWADKKLTKEQRGHMAFRYLDWLLTKNLPSGGFRLLYAITQCLNEINQFHCFPSIDYLAALIRRFPSTVWSMLPKLEEIGAIEIEWGSKGSGHPNVYRLPRAFLEFYFGPEKGQTPKPVLPPKKPRQVGVSKPRQIGVSDQLENPDTPTKKHRSTAKKPRHIGVSHFLATDSHKKERGSAARTARVERANVTEAKTTAFDAPLNPAKSTSQDAPIPAMDGAVTRAAEAALNDHPAAQQSSPERDATEIGTAAHADPAFAEVYQRGREVLGADADAVTAELLGAYDGDVESVLDAIAAAEQDRDPHRYVQMDIEAEAAARRLTTNQSAQEDER